MANFDFRACCADRADGNIGYTVPAGETFIPSGPVLETGVTQPARSLSVAIHEAAHAVTSIALGGGCSAVNCIPPAHATIIGLDHAERVVMSLAGQIAENWNRRTVYRPIDENLLPWLRMVRAPGGGFCDGCVALRNCVVLSGHASDEEAMAIFRRLEADAIRLVQAPPIWRTIRDLAAALLIEGTLAEAEILAIAGRYFRPGEFKLSTAA